MDVHHQYQPADKRQLQPPEQYGRDHPSPVPQWLKKMLSAAKDAVDKLGEEND